MPRFSLDGTRRALEPALRRVLPFYWRSARAVRVGGGGLVTDGAGRISRVKQGEVRGWLLPGGGVGVGETLAKAVVRELQEEGNTDVTAPPQLHGVFFNDRD